jgi:hypothetical protein
VTHVAANPVTGSVLVHYDSDGITQNEILQRLESFGCLQGKHQIRSVTENAPVAQDGFGHGILKTVVLSTLEFTVQRLVLALI